MTITFGPIKHPFGMAGYAIGFTFRNAHGDVMGEGHSMIPILTWAEAVQATWKARRITRARNGVLPNLSVPWTTWTETEA